MFEDLHDPSPPAPTAHARTRVEARARTLVRRRRTIVATAGALGVCVVVLAGAAVLDGPTSSTTEIAGVQQSNIEPAPGNASSPVTEPVSATGPLSATVTGELAVSEGFVLVGCTVNGAAVDVVGDAFRVEGLRSGTVVDVVCTAESGDGAARAVRESVELVEGDQNVVLDL